MTEPDAAVPQFLLDEISQIRDDMRRVLLILDGDARADVQGLRRRVELAEMGLRLLQGQREEDCKQRALEAAWRKGILLGLGLTGVTSTGTLVTLLVKILGGTP